MSAPLDQVKLLRNELSAEIDRLKALDAKIYNALYERFEPLAMKARAALLKDTGRIRLTEGEIEVVCDLPKKVTWNQAMLRRAMDEIKNEWQGDPAEYVKIVLSVSEDKYNAWPTPIKKVFEPARTVTPGKATYDLEDAKEPVPNVLPIAAPVKKKRAA